MNLKRTIYFGTATMLWMLPTTALAQTPDALSFYNFQHLVAYLMAALLITLFVLLFYNRLFVYNEQETDKKNRQQNERLKLVLRSANVRLWIYDVTGRHYQWLADDDNTDIYNPIDFAKFFDRNDFERMRNAVFDTRDGRKQTVTLEVRGEQPDDKSQPQAHFTVNVSVFKRNRQGHALSVLGIMRDTTTEHEQHEHMSQLLMQYHTVFNTALVDMVYYDAYGILTDVNDKACSTFNVSDREALLKSGLHLNDIPSYEGIDFHHIDSVTLSSITDLGSIPPETRKLPGLGASGKLYYESIINPIHDRNGKLLGVYMAGRNITEMVDSFHHQQEMGHRLRQATRRIQRYIDNINLAMQVSGARLMNYDISTHTLEISEALDKPQFLLTQLRCIRLAAPRDRRYASSILNQMDHRLNHSIQRTIQTIMHDANGRDNFLQLNLVPMLDEQGQVTHYFGMFRDMTDMVETERRLAAETKKAQETELLKNSFLLNMSYEIRTPLNTVLGFAELFENEHNPEDEGVFVEEIKKNSNSLLELINDILFLSRLDANMIEYNKEDTDFALFFDGFCQMGWSSVSPRVKTIIENPYNHLFINIDQNNLGQVIQKLCSNAAFFTQEGTIRAKYEYRRGQLTITIEDTGEGIDEKTLPRVFERFVRDHKERHCGTGLGLPIVQSLVQQMGGTIEFQSELGKGTTAWVTIPCEAVTLEKKKEIIA
ncbi:MAG: PAS domain-containing protein [Prevotella sp.]|nr:PAS domain-containing protein [Prevotella sp.]